MNEDIVNSRIGPLYIFGLIDRRKLAIQDVSILAASEVQPVGVVFLLVLNQEQLASAVKVQYGCSEESSWKHLRKYVDLTISLPHKELRALNSSRAARYLDGEINNVFVEILCERPFQEVLQFLCFSGGTAARDIKQIARLALVIHSTESPFLTRVESSQVVACLTFLSVVSPFLFARLPLTYGQKDIGDPIVREMLKRMGLIGGNLSEGDAQLCAGIKRVFTNFCESIKAATVFRHDGLEDNPIAILSVVQNLNR